MRSGYTVFFLGLCFMLGAPAAEPCYYISFDKTLQADFGGTGSVSTTTGDGSQEAVGMRGNLTAKSGKVKPASLLIPGLKGNAFCAGQDAAGNVHTILYRPKPEMRGNAGTVSFWIKPENWQGDDKNEHIFVSALNGSQRLFIYRIVYMSRLAVFLGDASRPSEATVIFTRVPSWKPGQWHQITVSWNERALQLHLDGKSMAMAKLKTPIAKDFSTLCIGENFGKNNPGRTLIDELRIFDRKLPEADLVNEYTRLAGKLGSAAEAVKFTAGMRTPSIDGVISETEYPFSTVGMRELRTRALSAEPMRIYLSSDQENLYVGAVTPGKALKTTASGIDGKVWLDDSIEILIYADPAKPEVHQLIFNSAGARYDSRADNPAWNADGCRSASKIVNGVWTFEAAIPWKSFGGKITAAGGKLRLNVGRNAPAANSFASLAGVMAQYNEAERFIPVEFAAAAPDFHLLALGNPGDGKLRLRAAGKSPSAGKIDVRCEAPAPLYAFDRSVPLVLTPGQYTSVEINGERLPDQPMLIITASKAGKVLYRNQLPCATGQPVVHSYLYTDIPRKQLVLVYKNQRLDGGKCQVNVIFFDRAKKNKIHEATAVIDDTVPVTEVKIPIAALAPGDYRIEQRVLDPAGKYLFSVEDVYMIPEGAGSWAGTKVGISDEIPKPWTPVKDENGTFHCWGRSYRFGGKALLTSLRSQGRELLKRPLAVNYDGKPLPWRIAEVKAKPDAVRYTLVSGDPARPAEIEVLAEYDGVIWFTLKLPAGQAKPKSLSLVIPLDRKYVDAFDDNSSCFEKTSLKTQKEFLFNVDPFANPFFWCGGNDVGLCGGTHTHRGRYVKDKRRAMSVAGTADEVVLTVNLVDTPIPNKKERVISFYLQPTPTKPLNPAPWRIRDRINNMVVFNAARYFNTTRPGHLDDYQKWAYHYGMIIKPSTAKDVVFQYYFAPKGAGAYTAEWNYFGRLWHNDPPALGNYACATNDFSKKPRGWTYGCLNCRNYLDFQLDSVAYYLDNPYLNVRDLYFDLSWPRSCGNPHHGCVWRDEFGYEHHDNDLPGLREFYRRVWHLVRQKNPDTFIIGHLISTRTPADTYFDVIAAGELYQSKLIKNGGINYYNVLNPELMRIAYGTRENEATVALIGQFSRALQLFMPDKWKSLSFDAPAVDAANRHFLVYQIVCGVNPYYYSGIRRLQQIYTAFDRLGDTCPQYHPWWDPAPAVRAEGALAALYTNNGKAIVPVLNDTDKPVKVHLAFRPDLGFEHFRGTGIFDGGSFSVKNNGIELELAPRGAELIFLEK